MSIDAAREVRVEAYTLGTIPATVYLHGNQVVAVVMDADDDAGLLLDTQAKFELFVKHLDSLAEYLHDMPWVRGTAASDVTGSPDAPDLPGRGSPDPPPDAHQAGVNGAP